MSEWNAVSYHRVSEPHQSWGASVLARLEVRGDERAVDLGCGTGRLTAELLDRLPDGHVVAVDRSRNMLDQARTTLAPRYGDRISFRQADLATFDGAALGQPVDLVFSTATFHWIADHAALARRIATMLKPGGWLVAQCGGGPNLAPLRMRAEALQATPGMAFFFAGWPGPWTFDSAEEMAAHLATAGFVQIETELVAAPTTMPDAPAYREFLATVVFGSHLARLPDDHRRAAYLDHLTEAAATDDPPYFLDYWRLNLRAQQLLRAAT